MSKYLAVVSDLKQEEFSGGDVKILPNRKVRQELQLNNLCYNNNG